MIRSTLHRSILEMSRSFSTRTPGRIGFSVPNQQPTDASLRIAETVAASAPLPPFRYNSVTLAATGRDEVQPTRFDDRRIRDFFKGMLQLDLPIGEIGTSFKSVALGPSPSKLKAFQQKMAYGHRELDHFCERFNASHQDVKTWLMNKDWRMLVMTSKNEEKNADITNHFLKLHTQLFEETGLRLDPAVVTYADGAYGKKNSNMTTKESIQSIAHFWEGLQASDLAPQLYLNLYISGVVGVTPESRLNDGVSKSIANTAKIQKTMQFKQIPHQVIYGDTAGQMSPEEAQTLIGAYPLSSKRELHLHHNPLNAISTDLDRLELVLRVFAKAHPLNLHIGIFGGGSPFSGMTGGFGGNLWLPFVCSLALRSNLTISSHPEQDDLIKLLATSIDLFNEFSPDSQESKSAMVDGLLDWNQKN
ncbi:MAG: hypothetical protein ACON35_02775 [Candidatus Marinamargulisbacteria bacterium]